MGESAPADGDASSDSTSNGDSRPIVNVSPLGDIVLDVTFETSQETIKKSRKAAIAAARKAGPKAATAVPGFKPLVNVAYRVRLDILKKHSLYFSNLLSNEQFSEARLVKATREGLVARGVKPSEAHPGDLPCVPIVDDDEAARTAGREQAFEDILRIIHGEPPRASKATMSYVATLAIIADRFDCAAAVSRSLTTELKFKWPVTSNRPLRDGDTGKPTEIEQILRQKILAAWLLGQPVRLQHATRELILRGSRLWSAYQLPTDSDPDSSLTAAWWNLPDGLEEELQYRRECVLNAVASIHRHFLSLYAPRAGAGAASRQCKLGYDSSAACDSFQLGQMIRFLLTKNLLFLADFSPASSFDALPAADAAQATLDVDADILAVLKQCPNYQIDKHHTNCGLRIRIDPIIDYVRAMLAANVVAISLQAWKKDRVATSWVVSGDSAEPRVFAFTRAMANDQRLRYEGAIYADRMAKELFTADKWDWTPEF
ncbi:proteinrelated to hydroxyproline-rich glycoprotein [Sarocladium implicatum]|nr:proteinrelated to hydroxyproline-rich glycoprotein [Sarocladium implicatum]